MSVLDTSKKVFEKKIQAWCTDSIGNSYPNWCDAQMKDCATTGGMECKVLGMICSDPVKNKFKSAADEFCNSTIPKFIETEVADEFAGMIGVAEMVKCTADCAVKSGFLPGQQKDK